MLSSFLFCCDLLYAFHNTDLFFFMLGTICCRLVPHYCVCVRALWTAPSLSYHPHQLLVSWSSPKSYWPSSNKPISYNQGLSHPFFYIYFDIYTHRVRDKHTWTAVNFSCGSFSLQCENLRWSVPKCSMASVAIQSPVIYWAAFQCS